ncbi:21567_t:CDS:2 [Cetraspora pellucida]|uniref:21567_t:CDS:1 n=1 Tax=Cetraspora pellucida TaxID=1433469 RepID=A0A9N9ACY6_9GLOM|nr:21567_t:CDS:2 [Cetraspora pellucida]
MLLRTSEKLRDLSVHGRTGNLLGKAGKAFENALDNNSSLTSLRLNNNCIDSTILGSIQELLSEKFEDYDYIETD